MNWRLPWLPIWDELPDEFDVKGTAPKLSRDTSGKADRVLIIPREIDEDLFYREASEHGRRTVKNGWGINVLLGDYHELGEWTFQDFLSEKLWIWDNFANNLAELVVWVYHEEDIDEEDDGVEELNPDRMTF